MQEYNELLQQPDIIEAKEFAIIKHRSTNHKYDQKPYSYHLEQVQNVALEFLHLLPKEDHGNAIKACWLHDVLEDCRVSYKTLVSKFNIEIAEIIYLLTAPKGRHRGERFTYDYYHQLKKSKTAVFVKLCDRIANAKYSKTSGSSYKYNQYSRELEFFQESLYLKEFDDMFHEILQTCDKETKITK